jgi:hypothetical protein
VTGIQIVTIAVALVMLFSTYTALRRRELRIGEFALWGGIWVALLIVSVFPDLLRGIIVPLHVIRLLDLVTIVGLLVMGVLVFSLNRALRRLEERLTAIARAMALDDRARAERPTEPGPRDPDDPHGGRTSP